MITSAFAGKPATAVPDYLAPSAALTSQTHSDIESERPQENPKPQAKFKVVLKNQDEFDGGRSNQTPMLDPRKEGLYKAYRVAYAHLLSIWGFPVQHSEVLKIGTAGGQSDELRSRKRSHNNIDAPLIVSSRSHKDDRLIDVDREGQGLGLQRHCIKCGQALQMSIFAPTAVEENGRNHLNTGPVTVTCQHCKPHRPLFLKLPCVICGEVVEGMLVPCLRCGHVTCFDCHRRWFSVSTYVTQRDKNCIPASGIDEEQEVQFCPSGCGCHCSEHIGTDIPTPLEPSTPAHERDASPTSTRLKRSELPARPSELSSSVDPHDDDLLGPWRESPFASLARGLGGGLSRGLRAKEDRRRLRPSSTAFIPKKSSMNQVEKVT